MASGTVTVKVRPLRIGFLVDPADRSGLYRAIELNTFLWGGSYNPIIPAYRRTPPKWEDLPVRHLPSPLDIVYGYLAGFDPDIVVPMGMCANRQFNVGNRDIVKEHELLGNLDDSASPRYGIGFFELLSDFIGKELKYKRFDDVKVSFPDIPRAYGTFLASVFGVLPKKAQQIINKHFSDIPGILKLHVKLVNLPELIRSSTIFPRRLTFRGLEYKPLQGATLFVCDATSTLDIIDYWNLRAAGHYVIPIPIQAFKRENMKILAQEFIERNYRPYRNNPEMFHHTTIQRSRSIQENTVKRFCESLKIPKREKKEQPSYLLQWWYPRLWDTWARENAFGEEISFPHAYEEEIRIPEGEQKLEFRSYDPKIKPFSKYTGNAIFANEFSFRFYGSKELMAEVFPEGSRKLSSAIGRIGHRDWRFSKFGPVFLARRYKDLIFLELPLAEAVMIEWLKERGWKVTVSGPGRIAKQLLRQLGGTLGISQIAHKGVIELLAELEREAGMPRQAVLEKLKHVIQSDGLFYGAERFLESLLSVNAMRLGARVKCPICTRYNWYELNDLDYELHCRFCLSDFSPPVDSPKDIHWTYRANGPFASSIAQGAFTVLLTLNLIGGNFDVGVTPIFSYEAEKDGKILEADLTCLYKPSLWSEKGIHVIHAECKSFNTFARKDIERMKELSYAFPGSTLIFATLKNELQGSELKLIQKLVLRERRNRVRGKPNSQIILLTGTELFSDSITEKWDKKGGMHKRFIKQHFDLKEMQTLADATQQIYLDLPSWFEWAKAERDKKKQKHMIKKKNMQSKGH